MKHLLTVIACIIFNNNIDAQLSILNDHYLFLNDEVIFIEDDLNLNDSGSTIYLRNESQLIQGNGLTANSGIGELSVYQNGNVGAYEYNYWCSPIGEKISTSINNAFGISLLHDITGITSSTPAIINHLPGYNSISSPLTIEPYWIWKYIASDTYWDWIHVKANNSINPGEGFTMKGTSGSSDSQNYDFRGKPNNGTISVEVSTNKSTLVGNPYPSAMDALAYIHDAENASLINGTLYYWEQDPNVNSHYLKDYDGGYATYTIDAFGVETYTPATFSIYDNNGEIRGPGSGSPSGKRPQRYIPIGQGFMVAGIADGYVKTKNSHRVYIKETHSNSEFFKLSNNSKKQNNIKNTFSIVPDGYKRFRLNISFNDSYIRQLVETFNMNMTQGFDYGLESKIPEKDILSSDAHWVIDGSSYVAEALPFSEKLNIPLTIRLNKFSSIKITIADIQNFEGNTPIYLHDLKTNSYTNLRTNNFDINLKEGYYNNRFEITFQNGTLSNDELLLKNLNIFNNSLNSEIIINNPQKLNIQSINLFDITGKLIFSKQIKNNKINYKYSSRNFNNGIYLVKLNLNNGHSISKKIKILN